MLLHTAALYMTYMRADIYPLTGHMAGSKTPHEISFGRESRVTPGYRKTAGTCRYIRRGMQPTRRISTCLHERAHTQIAHTPPVEGTPA